MKNCQKQKLTRLNFGLILGFISTTGLAFSSAAHAKPAQSPRGGNPFVHQGSPADLYVNPSQVEFVNALAADKLREAESLRKLSTMSTAVWLSSIADVSSIAHHLKEARGQETHAGKPIVPVFVVYDLPSRDCAAAASNGELSLKDESRYQHEYIDAIVAQFKAKASQHVVAIVEPDSLANIATNLNVKACADAEGVYRRGIAYAVQHLSTLPNVALYLDAAHGGWLGWPQNLPKIAKIFSEVLTEAGGADRIRGFAVNVSNYNAVLYDKPNEAPANPPHPRGPGINEIGYVDDLARALAAVGIKDKGYVIDTSRNGRSGIRSAGGNWCNIAGAGLGERPHVAPLGTQGTSQGTAIDAFLWIKIPGESDGVADPKAPRFDRNCASSDATPGAPQAGERFPSYLIDLVKNARPPL